MLFDAGENVQAYLPVGTDQRENGAENEWRCDTCEVEQKQNNESLHG